MCGLSHLRVVCLIWRDCFVTYSRAHLGLYKQHAQSLQETRVRVTLDLRVSALEMPGTCVQFSVLLWLSVLLSGISTISCTLPLCGAL